MAKLSQLLTLECMLDAYDSLNIKDSWIIERQGVYYDKARGQLPNWTFDDADGTEAIRRNNVGKRFLNLVKRE